MPPNALNELDESALAVHMRAMESLEDVLTMFVKLRDVEGIHEAARCVAVCVRACVCVCGCVVGWS